MSITETAEIIKMISGRASDDSNPPVIHRDRMHPYLGIATWWSVYSCFLDSELDHVTYPNQWVEAAWFSLSLILLPFSIRRNCLTQLVPN